MIIKSFIRGGYRSAAAYLKAQGQNEFIRLMEMSDPHARNLDEAFRYMWMVASKTKATKPLHHISINPSRDERLADDQVYKIIDRCEKVYGYKKDQHQRVMVEHIKNGRQHFHVVWNRVNLLAKSIWPGLDKNKSVQICREMEVELGLKSPKPRIRGRSIFPWSPRYLFKAAAKACFAYRQRKIIENVPDSEKLLFRRPEWDTAELIRWAWENGRADILAQFGIFIAPEELEP